VIDGFIDTGVVDEVLVVNNNAEAGTEEEIAKTKARQVFEPQQGYGHATRRGLLEASGELIVLAEPTARSCPRTFGSCSSTATNATRSSGPGRRAS
jgi:hypothetical protein